MNCGHANCPPSGCVNMTNYGDVTITEGGEPVIPEWGPVNEDGRVDLLFNGVPVPGGPVCANCVDDDELATPDGNGGFTDNEGEPLLPPATDINGEPLDPDTLYFINADGEWCPKGSADGFTDPNSTNALGRSSTKHYDENGVLIGETCNADLLDLITDDARNCATGITCSGEFNLSVLEERSRDIATAAVNDLLIDNAWPTTTFFVTNANGGINGVDPVASAAAQLGPIVEDTLICGGSFTVEAWWAYWVDAISENGTGAAVGWVDPSPNADPNDPSNGWPHGKPEMKLEISVMPTAAGVYAWANMRSDGVNQNMEFETGIWRPGTAPINPISGNPLPEGTRYPLNYGIGDQNTYYNVWHSEDDTPGERIHRDTSGALLQCDVEYTIAARQVLLKSVDLGFFGMSNWELRGHSLRLRRF